MQHYSFACLKTYLGILSELVSSFFHFLLYRRDRLCGLVVGVHGYRSSGPGTIPGATRFSEK
jgi:hypothetical protein